MMDFRDGFVLKVLVILNIVPKSVDTCHEPVFIYMFFET